MGALIDLLQQIIELLNDIKTNTTPADTTQEETPADTGGK